MNTIRFPSPFSARLLVFALLLFGVAGGNSSAEPRRAATARIRNSNMDFVNALA
jgi:hypothetical protein